MHATNPLELPNFIIKHKPPDPIFQKALSWQMARGRRLAWRDWLRAVLRWPIAPWRCMTALLDRVAQLEAVMAGHLTTLSRLQGALDHDGLTGAHSRLYFMAALRQEVARFAREHRAPGGARGFVVGLLDLDQFKLLNDRYGHATGDEALILVVAQAQRILRRDLDVFARYGGDEFVFLLPQTSLQSAHVLADKLCAAAAALRFDKEGLSFSTSIGLAACPEHGMDAEALLHAADRAMYQAKRLRNSVCIAEAS